VIKWISLADCPKLDDLYISETQFNISKLGILNSSAVLHPPGIVVLSRDAGVGKSAITTEPMAVSQHFMCWLCSASLNNHFLYYWLQYHKRSFENIATGSTIPTIGLAFFRKYQIARPSLVKEQEQIASCLVAMDQCISASRDELKKLRNLRLGLSSDLLDGKVRVIPEKAGMTHV
jgi:type I restriction enzyme S subunit